MGFVISKAKDFLAVIVKDHMHAVFSARQLEPVSGCREEIPSSFCSLGTGRSSNADCATEGADFMESAGTVGSRVLCRVLRL